MDLAKHYESYKQSLMRDALAGFPEYAATLPTKKPEKWPTTQDYLRHAVTKINTAIQINNEAEYKLWLKSHQSTIIMLFEHMVESHLKGSECVELDTLIMIKEKGWNWFKFAAKPLKFDVFVWIPRYDSKYQLEDGRPVFCANEMDLIFKSQPGKDVLDSLRTRKTQSSFIVTGFTAGVVSTMPIHGANTNLVREWTLPI